ncbi:MAG: class I adenylate-forming enzyme family protein [Bdellovibrionales bacterium]
MANSANNSEWTEQDWLKRWAQYAPSKIPLKDLGTGREFSYQLLYRWSVHLARHLQSAQVKAGDRVAILSKNHWVFLPLFFACQRLGAALVPINFRLAPREVAHILNDCKPELFIHAEEYTDLVDQLLIHPDLDTLNPTCWKTDEIIHFLDNHHDDVQPLEMVGDEHTLAMILYTSGTTGAPKGAMIDRRMLFWNSLNTTLRLDIRQSDVHISFLPFFHTGGWNVLVTPFLHWGAKTLLLDKFEPETILSTINDERVTILFGVPTMLDMLARSPKFASSQLSSLRFAIVGGEPMPLPLIRQWQARGVPIRQGYGLTEFGPNVFSLNEEHSERKLGSIGFPNFYVEAKIIGNEGQELGPEQVGELLLRGPTCMPGYWQNAQATASTIQEGWLHTGDLVRRDEEGFYYVVGRKKDMFISGGENVYPAEIEQFLRQHPLIQEAAVIGVPDERWGESGKAFVVLKKSAPTLTQEAVLQYCQGQMAKYKIPREVCFLTELPKGDSGKILKRVLLEKNLGERPPKTESQISIT